MTTSRYIIDELRERIDADLAAVIDARDFPFYRMMSYHLGWSGAGGEAEASPRRSERIHGVLTLLSCAAVGGDIETCLPAAGAIELVDKFTEIHDDVQEGSPRRNERDAVWWVWGPAQAINAGDGMHALGRLALLRLLERGIPEERVFRALRHLDEASLRTCEGRFRDLEAQERIDLSVSAYMKMAADKSGALMDCAMRVGALIGGAGDEAVEALAGCGSNLGIALQIRSDLAAIWGYGEGSQPNVEVLNKKKLLPVVIALENASLSEKRAMGEIYFKRVLEPEDALKLRGVIEAQGARSECEGMAAALISDSIAKLDHYGVSGEGRERIAEYIGLLVGVSAAE